VGERERERGRGRGRMLILIFQVHDRQNVKRCKSKCGSNVSKGMF
jgi:hypothetical protein